MTSRSRVSYPAAYDLGAVLGISQVLLMTSLPLAILCEDQRLKLPYREKVAEWRRDLGANSEVIALAGILGFLARRRIAPKDLKVVIPGLDIELGTVLRGLPSGSAVSYLTKRGIELAASSSPNFILFDAIVRNKTLPPLFTRTIQCENAYERILSVEELEAALSIPAGRGRPEARCIVKWSQYLGINIAQGLRILLDMTKVTHFLLYCLKLQLEHLLDGGELKAFSEVRQSILGELNLDPSFAFDRLFEILYRAQEEGTFSFRGGRQTMVGAWKGLSGYAFVSMAKRIALPGLEYVDAIAENRDKGAES